MELIQELINELTNTNCNIENALVKAQLLAHKLKANEMASWVTFELRGYPDNESVPPYRRLPLTVMGTLTNGFHTIHNQNIHLGVLTPEQREAFTTMCVSEGIGAVAGWVAKDGDNANMGNPVTPEICGLLSKGYQGGYGVRSAMRLPAVGAYRQIITEVRSRLLAFALELDGRVAPTATAEEVRAGVGEQSISELFNNAVFGNNTTIFVAGHNATQSANVVIRNDFPSLAQQLKKIGIDDGDINELKTAIQQDEGSADHEKQNFGEKVRAWIGSTVSKVGTEAWKTSGATAVTALYAALKAHYGWP